LYISTKKREDIAAPKECPVIAIEAEGYFSLNCCKLASIYEDIA